MADKIVLDASTIHSLHDMAKKLYITFSTADKKVISDNTMTWTNEKSIDYAHNPHNYYRFYCADKSVAILKKQSHYHLECFGFKPEGIDLAFPEQSARFDLFKNLYGSWSDFNQCLNAFFDCVNHLTELKPGALIF